MDVQVALKALSAKERTVVLLFYLEEMPVKKVVEITGMPERHCKSLPEASPRKNGYRSLQLKYFYYLQHHDGY